MDLSKHLINAADAVKRKNYALAISLYSRLLSFQPDNGEARAGLRQALFKRAQAKAPSKLGALLGGGIHRLTAGFASLLGRHGAAAKAYERYLVFDPLNEDANLKLGGALEKSGLKQSAQAVYRAFAEAMPRCKEAAKRAGNLLQQHGEVDLAMQFYEQALRVDPRDQDALRARKNLAAEGALRKTNIEHAQSSAELIKDKEAARKIEKSQRIQLTKDEIAAELMELESKLGERPDDRAVLSRVAELRELEGDLRGALDCVERVVQLAPQDIAAAAKMGELRIGLQERLVAAALQRNDKDAAQRAGQVLSDLRIAESRRRVANHPTDMNARYDLGMALLGVDKVDEAIAELQQAVKDPRRRAEAMLGLAQAFERKDLPDLALGQLEKALEINGTGSAGKEILYSIGGLHWKQGRTDLALASFSRILEQDIGFKDVARKVDELKRSGTGR